MKNVSLTDTVYFQVLLSPNTNNYSIIKLHSSETIYKLVPGGNTVDFSYNTFTYVVSILMPLNGKCCFNTATFFANIRLTESNKTRNNHQILAGVKPVLEDLKC